MILTADKSVDFGIIKELRLKGIEVFSIAETSTGITDKEVLQIANYNNSLLITEDKDFGELAYRLKLQHSGILLIRLSDIHRPERIILVREILLTHADKLTANFSVLNKSGLRIKKAQNKG